MLTTPRPRTVARFTETVGVRRVDFPAGKWDPFHNFNTPDDLAVARGLSPLPERGPP
jgi:molybdopterin-guanine dinucleotide biosynthesis protein A